MKRRIRGYLIRLKRRTRSSWKSLMWINDFAVQQPIGMTDYGFMDQFRFCISEPWYALTHFPSRQTAESWIRYEEADGGQ